MNQQAKRLTLASYPLCDWAKLKYFLDNIAYNSWH